MSREHYSNDTEHVRRSNSVAARRLTSDILHNQTPSIPTPKGYASRRMSYDTREHKVSAQRFYSDENGSGNGVRDDLESDEAYSDVLSDSSTDNPDVGPSSTDNPAVDPFMDSEELQGKVAQLKEQLADVRERLNQAKIELALEQSRRPILYDDSYFIMLLDDLRTQIRRWTVTNFSHAGGLWTINAERRFRRLSDDWAAYMEDKNQRPWLIQARVWHILQQLLFDPESNRQFSYLFTGPTTNYSIDRMLAQASQESTHANRVAYLEWRAFTFALLFPGKGTAIEPTLYMQEEIDDRVKYVQNQIWRSLWTYARRDISKIEKEEARDSLKGIALAAICFNLDMKKHTAEISLSSQSCRIGLDFDPGRMIEMIDRNGQGRVRLVVSPPLYKERYLHDTTKRTLLQQAQVCSSILERYPRNGFRKALGTVYMPGSSRSKHKH